METIILQIIFLIILMFANDVYANTTQNICNPFTVNCQQSSGTLSKYKITQLEVIGTIIEPHFPNNNLAFIKTPDANIFPIFLQQRLGSEHGLVINITNQKIFIQLENSKIMTLKISNSFINNKETSHEKTDDIHINHSH